MPKVLIVDPANPARDGLHEVFGDAADALNGNVSRVFLTGVPQSVPTTDCRQPDGWSCGPYSLAECLGQADGEDARSWLLQRGWITYESGTWYEGIVGYLVANGYSCEYDGRAHDAEMSGEIFDKIINHLSSGYKVILCMHGTKKGCRTNYWTKSGHYICVYGIEDQKLKVDGYWGPTTTTFAQRVFGIEQDGIVSNQPRGMWGRLFPHCQEESWQFVTDDAVGNGSELIRRIQAVIGVKVDGVFGPKSVKAFQKRLGVKQDGNVGPKTVKAWQKWLNKQI